MDIEKWLRKKQRAAEKTFETKGDYTEPQRHLIHVLHYMSRPADQALSESLIDVLRQFESDVLDD